MLGPGARAAEPPAVPQDWLPGHIAHSPPGSWGRSPVPGTAASRAVPVSGRAPSCFRVAGPGTSAEAQLAPLGRVQSHRPTLLEPSAGGQSKQDPAATGCARRSGKKEASPSPPFLGGDAARKPGARPGRDGAGQGRGLAVAFARPDAGGTRGCYSGPWSTSSAVFRPGPAGGAWRWGQGLPGQRSLTSGIQTGRIFLELYQKRGFYALNSVLSLLSFCLKMAGEKVLANVSSWRLFFIARPHSSAEYIFMLAPSSIVSKLCTQTHSPKRNPGLATSSETGRCRAVAG